MTDETKEYLRMFWMVALPVVLTAIGTLAFCWRAGVQLHIRSPS